MSPKEIAILLAVFIVVSMGMLAYTDVYPPDEWTQDRPIDSETGLSNETRLENDDTGGPSAAPQKTPSEPQAAFPRGLNRDHVENPTILSRTHRDVLLEAGSWTRDSETTFYANGTEIATAERTMSVLENGRRASGKAIVNGEQAGKSGLYGPDLVYWSNESWTLVRYLESNHTSVIERYERYPVPFEMESTEWWTLNRLFAETNTTFEGTVSHGETTVYRISGTKRVYVDSPYGDVRNLTLSAMITAEGLVKPSIVSFLRRDRGQETRVFVHVEYSHVGMTTENRPTWVPENPDNVPQDPDTTPDARYDSIRVGALEFQDPIPNDRLAGGRPRNQSLPVRNRVAP